MPPPITRFAPSPTGHLHLGHAYSALFAERTAKAGGGRFFSKGDTGQPIEALQSMLAMYGYKAAITGAFDENTAAVVAAFQRHFRPARVDGVADASTIETLHRLLTALPALS